MKEYDLLNTLLKKFNVYINSMEESFSDKKPIAKSGEAKLSLKIFTDRDNDDNPIEKISFMTLKDGKIKNKHDKSMLDSGEFTTATFIPKDTFPLPLCAMEVSFHFDKYLRCRADIPPLSTDKQYQETFCTPVQELRKKNKDFPGLLPIVSLPGLEEFSSGGLLAGDFNLADKDTILKWFLEYAELYLTFLNEREDYPLLKSPSIIDEGSRRKTAFRQMFKKMTPRILSDTPDLYSDELAGKLGDLLF